MTALDSEVERNSSQAMPCPAVGGVAMSRGEGDTPPTPHAAQVGPLLPTLPAAPGAATLTVSLRGWWKVKMRWWKPSGEGVTQKPPAEGKGHVMSKCQTPRS